MISRQRIYSSNKEEIGIIVFSDNNTEFYYDHVIGYFKALLIDSKRWVE